MLKWVVRVFNSRGVGLKNGKTCSFFGHRKINADDKLREKVSQTIEFLITERGVENFLFGSKSEFNSVCHVETQLLKEKYPFITRVAYTCKSEGCNLESKREENERMYFMIFKREVELLWVDEEVNFKNKWVAGKSGYIQRNYAMIDESDYCVFYYDEKLCGESKVKSGTKTAYEYARKKGKIIINLAENKS